MTAVERLLDRLEHVRKNGRGWTANCPAHDDRHASLSVAIGDEGRVLVKCFAGCAADEVVEAAGLTLADLFDGGKSAAVANTGLPRATPRETFSESEVAGYAKALLANQPALARLSELRGWSPEAVERLGIGLDGDCVVFPAREAKGRLTGVSRYRPNPCARGARPKLRAAKGSRRELFPPPEGINPEEVLLVVEGEPDAVRCWSLGVPAVAVPGVEGWRSEWASRFAGRSVCVCFDSDAPGRRAAVRVASDLTAHAAAVRVLDLAPDREDGFDLSDFFQDARSDADQEAAGRLLRDMTAHGPPFTPQVTAVEQDMPFALAVEAFIACRTETPSALLGDETENLLPAAGLLILFAKGGKGKTTLTLDLALHLISGVTWLGFTVERPLRILLVENEGPREPFRAKLQQKLAAWPHPIEGGLFVHALDWGAFSLADTEQQGKLREFIETEDIDVVIGDPLDSLGIDGVGSPDDTRAFVTLLSRVGLFRDVAFVLLHHARKESAGDELDEASGAWGGKPDTMLRLDKQPGNKARLSFPKVRWSSHGTRSPMILSFEPETESFSVICEEKSGERDYLAEIEALLSDGKWRTAKEIAAPKQPKLNEDGTIPEPGIGANVDTVREVLDAATPAVFVSMNGKSVGRSGNATVWSLTRLAESHESDPDSARTNGTADSTDFPYKGSQASESVPPATVGVTQPREPVDIDTVGEP